jgi:flagellin
MIDSAALSNSAMMSRLNARATTLNSIVGMAASGSGGTAVNEVINGARAINDHLAVATGARFTEESAGLAAASSSAREAASLLQAADMGLTDIGGKLAEMKVLVEIITTSTNPATSTLDRAILDRNFSDLRAEIDVIAGVTEFNGVDLLQGDGAGGPFQVTFRVGTGQESADQLTISLDSALVADLSAGLVTDSLATIAGATAALTNVTAAVNNLNAIKGAVEGYQEAVFLAAENAGEIATGLVSFNSQRVAVDVIMEAAQFLGQEIAQQSGASLTHPDAQLMRGMLGPQDSSAEGGASTPEPAPEPASDD